MVAQCKGEASHHLFKAPSLLHPQLCHSTTLLLIIPAEKSPYLKHGEEGLGKVIKCAPPGLHFIKVELSSKELHPQEGEDDDEEEEEQQ